MAATQILTDINAKLAAIVTDVAGLKGDVAGLKGDVAGLKGDMAEVKGDILANAASFDDHISRINIRLQTIEKRRGPLLDVLGLELDE